MRHGVTYVIACVGGSVRGPLCARSDGLPLNELAVILSPERQWDLAVVSPQLTRNGILGHSTSAHGKSGRVV